MPGADVGPEDPLPPLALRPDLHAMEHMPGVPADVARNVSYGRVRSTLPYTLQNRYTRSREMREFRVAVLENEILRATFLLELGGRLWSLLHKPTGRELLHTNPVFQPANLAIRNAWFSGGVEWNIGTIGHSPFTCSPMFAGRVTRPDGTPVLRLYEWERIRQVPFQIDACLPGGSPVLFIHVRIVNPHDHDVPMYWWSNISVPETADTRVVVPAEDAYRFGYSKGGLRRVPIPELDGVDVSYATNIGQSMDFFFHVPDDQRHWITALNREGKGLVQTSTPRLKGRKLFVWGNGPGGKRWQEFLSAPGEAYIEIQAGLARTQAEHVPMPANTEWTWSEAYGLMEADPGRVHGASWGAARNAVLAPLETLVPQTVLETEHARSCETSNAGIEEEFQHGSGWGALERIRREAGGETPFCGPELRFHDDSLQPAQEPWIALLKHGTLPDLDPGAEPRGCMVQTEWQRLLEKAVGNAPSNWLTWLHLGVMRYYKADLDGARQAWEASLAAAPTAWAARNLAALAKQEGRPDEAASRYVEACRRCPSLSTLAVECGTALLEANRSQDWLHVVAELPEPLRHAGRIRLLEGRAALAAGDLPRVEQILAEAPVVDDLREGERSLSDLWFAYHEQRLKPELSLSDEDLQAHVRREFAVPPELDFRMS